MGLRRGKKRYVDAGEAEGPEAVVEVNLYLTTKARDRAHQAAEHTGDSFVDTVNRSIVVYERLVTAEPGQVVSWTDAEGVARQVMVVE